MPGQESRPLDTQPEPRSAPGARLLCELLCTARLRPWGTEWRPGLVPCPHQQGQSEYVTNCAQGGPGTLGWDWDRGAGARFLAQALSARLGRSQRTKKSAARPVTYRESGPWGTRQRHPVTSVSGRGGQRVGKPGASPAPREPQRLPDQAPGPRCGPVLQLRLLAPPTGPAAARAGFGCAPGTRAALTGG